MRKRFRELSALLLSCALLAGSAFAAPTSTRMTPSASKLVVDGKAVSCAAYDVKAPGGNSNTYFKLRDVAAALNGTAARFQVDWDKETGGVTVVKGKAYTPVGGELSGAELTAGNGALSDSALMVDGVRTYLTAYALNSNNYFMLRDLGMALDFGVDWDGTAGAVVIDTAKGYRPDGGTLSVCLAAEPPTMDPTLCSYVDGMNMIAHLFEGLMRWKDDGTGNAVLTPGQAERYEKRVNTDGTVTYTFYLKDGIRWSDGKAVTANDFLYSWRRLADPKTRADYSYMLEMVKGWDKNQPEISAPDNKTFVVTLSYDSPYFLEATAHTATMPLRQDTVEMGYWWTQSSKTYISNGPYRLSAWEHDSQILMERNNFYSNDAGPSTLRFALTDDNYSMLKSYREGKLDLITDFPVGEIPALRASGELGVEDYIGTYFACFNTQKAPFDDARVRQAFSLAIDRNFIVEQVTRTGQLPADAFVAPGAQGSGGYGTDFHDEGAAPYWSVSEADYAANCAKARQLLAEAGYSGGAGFPAVTYIYNTSDAHRAVAQALQAMWKNVLGVQVNLYNMEWNAFLDARQRGEFNIARHGWIADQRDPQSFLDMWITGSGNNDAQYSNPDYDKQMRLALQATDLAARMKYFHAAEDILMQDMAVMPIYFYTNKYLQSPDVTGIYYNSLGLWYFDKAVIKR